MGFEVKAGLKSLPQDQSIADDGVELQTQNLPQDDDLGKRQGYWEE